MFLAGILLGIAATVGIIAILMKAMPVTPDSAIMVGQSWYINGAGLVCITKVLNTGSFKEYGVGVNIQYMLPDGQIGHCTSQSLIKNGRLKREIKSVNLDSDYFPSPKKAKIEPQSNYTFYDKNGKTRILDVRFRNPR